MDNPIELNAAKTIVLASGFWRLKAPRWHLGALLVSDPRAGMVYCIDLDGKVTVVADVPTRPSRLLARRRLAGRVDSPKANPELSRRES
jgi:hypothetical protein